MADGNRKARAFLAAYKVTANVTAAAAAAGVARDMHYRWLADKKGYRAAFGRAKEEAAQSLEDEATRRAMEGVLEPKFYKGKAVGAVRVYSDALLLARLRASMPEKYRERGAVEVTGAGGGPIELDISAKESLRTRIAGIAARLGVGAGCPDGSGGA